MHNAVLPVEKRFFFHPDIYYLISKPPHHNIAHQSKTWCSFLYENKITYKLEIFYVGKHAFKQGLD